MKKDTAQMAIEALETEKNGLLWHAEAHPVTKHPDDIAVDAFSVAMKIKLAKKRTEGKFGWQSSLWTTEQISWQLWAHLNKGDPVDVANYCMFLSARNALISPRITPQEPAVNAELLELLRDASAALGGIKLGGISNDMTGRVIVANASISEAIAKAGGAA